MVISLAIFGILMMLFTTLMGIAIQMRRNVFEQNRSSMKSIKELAEDRDIKRDPQKEIVLKFKDGKKLTIPGELKMKEEGDVTYYVFEPYEYEVKEND